MKKIHPLDFNPLLKELLINSKELSLKTQLNESCIDNDYFEKDELIKILLLEDAKKILSLRHFISKTGYISFNILKNNGTYREINTPKPLLKKVQNLILKEILNKQQLPDCCTGFRKNKSTKDNAIQHVGAKTIIRIDIKNFFRSTLIDHADRILPEIGINNPLSSYLFKMLCFKDSALPQGAPTSPMLSNICFKKVDNTILSFCDKNNIIYTRYADDLTFSGDNLNIKNIIAIISQILKKNGYQINKQKTKVMRPGSKKIITGIIVNEKLSISRHLRRKLRAAIHNLNQGKQPYLNGQNISLNQIQGYINYIEGISTEQSSQLRKQLAVNKKI